MQPVGRLSQPARQLGAFAYRAAMTIDRRRHVAAVLRLLNDADPYGLASSKEMGVPDDELLTEATQISAIAVMRECSSCDLDDVWRRWFDEPLTAVIGVMATEKLARRVNGLRRGDLIAGASSDRAGS